MLMAKFTKKKITALVTIALVLGVSGTAFAYWTQTGGGTATATTAPGLPVVVKQTSLTLTGGLIPGGPGQDLSGNFDNPSTGPATVGVVTAKVTATSVPATCFTTWYDITGTATPATQVIPAGSGQGAWTGLKVALRNELATNQDPCKGATITITYAVAAGV
jgi:hypothetical protein